MALIKKLLRMQIILKFENKRTQREEEEEK